jgi:hypothetical protein
MEQYRYTGEKRALRPMKTAVGPTLAESQLMDIVRRLSLLSEQQSRQIRRLESELDQVKETVNRKLR